MSVIAEKITAARSAKKWTRYRLAKESGLEIGHISGIEDGKFAPRVDTLEKICKALGIVIEIGV